MQSLSLQPRPDHLFRGPRIGRALERQQLPLAQMRQQRLHRPGDELQIGFAGAGQRRGHADDQRIGFRRLGIVRGRLKSVLKRVAKLFARDRGEIALRRLQRCDFFGVDIEADGPESGFGESAGERQADVSKANDADRGIAGAKPREQRFSVWILGNWRRRGAGRRRA